MKREIRFEAGYDCIKFECKFDSDTCKPDEDGSHGRHGLNIRFLVIGEEGAVQFLLFTGWLPQYSRRSRIGYRVVTMEGLGMPADLGYHAKKPQFEGQESIGACEYLDGADCYYDGSSLNASDAYYALVNGGEDALWEFLEGYYKCVFEDAKYPKPPEYPKPRRSKRS